MTELKPLRLFLAVSVPEKQLSWLADEVAPLRRQWPELRWTPAENQHVTLKFLGSTAPERLEDVVAVCAAVAATRQPSEVRLAELGAFPSPRRARVLWAGIADPADTLRTLASLLDEALAPLGFAAEKRAFTAHLTLARAREPLRLDQLPALGEPPPGFPLHAFGLWRSHLSPRGARYEQLREFAFGHSE